MDWPGLKQAGQIFRKRLVGKKVSEEKVCFITSLSQEKANAKGLMQIWRDHWSIENSLHYVRDVTFREDFCRCRTPILAHFLTTMRNLAILLLKRMGFKNRAEGIEWFGEVKRRSLKTISDCSLWEN